MSVVVVAVDGATLPLAEADGVPEVDGALDSAVAGGCGGRSPNPTKAAVNDQGVVVRWAFEQGSMPSDSSGPAPSN